MSHLTIDAIIEIQDSEANGISLPKLSISDRVVAKLVNIWNADVLFPKRGIYRPYVEQTITRYAQNRQFWKNNLIDCIWRKIEAIQ